MFTVQGQALVRSFNVAFTSIAALEEQWSIAQTRVGEIRAEFGAERVHVSMERPPVLGENRKVTLDQANRHLLALRTAVDRLEAEIEREIRRNQRALETAAEESIAANARAADIVSDLFADMVRSAPDSAVRTEADAARTGVSVLAESRPPVNESVAVGDSGATVHTTTDLAESAIDRVIGRLMPEVPESARTAILAVAAKRPEDAFKADAHLTEVRRRVQEANQAAKRWPEEEEALHLLLLQVRAFEGEAAEGWASALEACLSSRTPLEADRRAAVEAFVLAEASAEERHAVQSALEETLAELGYEVGGAFETLFVEGGSVFVQRPAWGEYFVRWRVDGESGEANTNVVRAPGPGDGSAVDRARRDREIEEAWCGDVAGLREALAERGIHANLVRETPAGALPVPVVQHLSIGTAQARAGRVHRPAARQRRE